VWYQVGAALIALTIACTVAQITGSMALIGVKMSAIPLVSIV
jgi:hypothetical protein